MSAGTHVRRGPKPCAISLTDSERQTLSQWATMNGLKRRRMIIARWACLADQGVPNRQIAERVGLNQNQVGMWRKRYAAFGVSGLVDLHRSGRPRKANHVDGQADG